MGAVDCSGWAGLRVLPVRGPVQAPAPEAPHREPILAHQWGRRGEAVPARPQMPGHRRKRTRPSRLEATPPSTAPRTRGLRSTAAPKGRRRTPRLTVDPRVTPGVFARGNATSATPASAASAHGRWTTPYASKVGAPAHAKRGMRPESNDRRRPMGRVARARYPSHRADGGSPRPRAPLLWIDS